MSQQKRDWAEEESFSEEDVVDYLRRHPEFFERQPQSLAGMKLNHPTGGGAISLVERQVTVLRQKNTELERKLKDLISVAKVNDGLVKRMHKLAVTLLGEPDISRRLTALESNLREQFAAEQAVLVLFDDVAMGQKSNQRFCAWFAATTSGLVPSRHSWKALAPVADKCGIRKESSFSKRRNRKSVQWPCYRLDRTAMWVSW